MNKRSFDMSGSSSDSPKPKRLCLRTAMLRISKEEHSNLDEKILLGVPHSLKNTWDSGDANFWIREVVRASTDHLEQKYADTTAVHELLDEFVDLIDQIKDAWERKKFASIRNLEILQQPRYQEYFFSDQRVDANRMLSTAYNTPYLGDAAKDFICYLRGVDCSTLYAKTISVVQSSGTGKSRMLTEVSKYVFTLPICIRNPADPGYPPSDAEVFSYFNDLSQGNNSSDKAYIATSSFIAAAHAKMLTWLRKEKVKNKQDVDGLLEYWSEVMEPITSNRKHRDRFFSEVIQDAYALRKQKSPPSPGDAHTTNFYYQHARQATQDLTDFLTSLSDKKGSIYITYFDGAHRLGLSFWILVGLCARQDASISMWYVFMSTKSSIAHCSPELKDYTSPYSKGERHRVLPPYIALGFDHHMVAKPRETRSVTMDHLSTIDHLCQYGRACWSATLQVSTPDSMVQLAALKLTEAKSFDPANTDHVFAVLSQRLCIDPVLANSEAIKLADRSVAHHMRLLTDYSEDTHTFYTHSSSEPMLALGAFHILYNDRSQGAHLCKVLDTFRQNLCRAGLVEMGLPSELGARILLLLARDFAAPVKYSSRDPLKPVSLLEVLHKLFGDNTWGEPHQARFNEAFKHARVNFTHWIVTEDPLPTDPDQQLLANLWARGAALQCCSNQESLDCLIATYNGPDTPGAVFDPTQLSGAVVQTKLRNDATADAESLLRPIGLPRDMLRPLPYLALLLELGSSATYQENNKHIKTKVPAPSDDDFTALVDVLTRSMAELKQYEAGRRNEKGTGDDPTCDEKRQAVKECQLTVDSFNRYSISIRGHSSLVYGLLKEAKIENEFAALLSMTLPQNREEAPTSALEQHMWPLRRLDDASAHTDWTTLYI